MMYLLLAVGFILLLKGADIFVVGSSSIAKILKIPTVIIGLTIVAMGTSSPEAAVSINAGLAGSNEIALSNIIGSNLFNLLVVIGICAVMNKVATDYDILKRDMPINILVTILLAVFLSGMQISRMEGMIFLVLIIAYVAYLIYTAIRNRVESTDDIEVKSPLVSILYIIIGLIAVIFGGDLVVDNACLIAAAFGLSETLIGLTIVAIGTSLPELVTSIVATKRGDVGLALGNVIGSNIFNILFILGISSSITPIASNMESLIDIIILIIVTCTMYIFAKTKNEISRTEGAICIAAYIGYMIYAIVR